jgi:hypothetical protein
MKIWHTFLLICCLSVGASGAPFQNLSFDDADTNSVTRGGGGLTEAPVPDLLPGWQISNSRASFEWMNYNSRPPGFGWVSLLPPENFGHPPYPVFGRYSVALEPLGPGFESGNPITLRQRAEVPHDARELRFVNWGALFDLRLNGSLTPVTYYHQEYLPNPFVRDPEYLTRFASVDISGFAGQTVEISFDAFYRGGRPSIHGLDSIEFVVPEPATWLLLGLGGVALVAGHRWRHRSAHATKCTARCARAARERGVGRGSARTPISEQRWHAGP